MLKLIARFSRAQRGNVVLIFAFALVPIMLMVGVAADYGMAHRRKTTLQAAADAAALAAASTRAKNHSNAEAINLATQAFLERAAQMSGLTATPAIAVTQNGLAHTATVSFSATSTNFFAGVVGQTLSQLTGSATATITATPNIDFYMLLDNSPSMALAATTAGINTMLANTTQQGGCAFACHETTVGAADYPGNPPGVDNYALAQQLGVVTRIKNVATATQSVANSAASLATQTGAAFRMSINTFTSSAANNGVEVVRTLTSDLTAAGTAAATVDVLTVCKQNYTNCAVYDYDTNTDFSSALAHMNGVIPNPGTGASGSSPQSVLFIVTDGVEDKNSMSCSRALLPAGPINRCVQPFDTSGCATLKQRGIRIAILYTQYFPLTGTPFYDQHMASFQSQIGPNLQSCASPGLFYTVTTDEDITNAMTSLFGLLVTRPVLRLSH